MPGTTSTGSFQFAAARKPARRSGASCDLFGSYLSRVARVCAAGAEAWGGLRAGATAAAGAGAALEEPPNRNQAETARMRPTMA